MRKFVLCCLVAASLAACTPSEGATCTTVGERVQTSDGRTLICSTDTDAGQHVPHWNAA